MLDFQQAFIDLAVSAQALRFGEFTLKSGRNSPYFFNAGQFSRGEQLAKLGQCYASKIVESGIEFDLLFGPAYKGIPLVAVTAAALSTDHGIDVPYAFNRKEAKRHGEGGSIVGAELAGQILIVDDVITAGTAIREVIQLLGSEAEGAKVCGVVIGLDRQEKAVEDKSAVEALRAEFGIGVQSIINVKHLLEYLENNVTDDGSSRQQILRMQDYWQKYGCIESN